MRNVAFIIWATIAVQLTGCGSQGLDSQSGNLRADTEIETETPVRFAEDVRAALGPCWTIDPERPYVTVELDVTVRRDGTVSSATVFDQDSYRTDPSFRAAADRALRAVLNPHCQPLPLPAADWPTWSEITLVFHPGPSPNGS